MCVHSTIQINTLSRKERDTRCCSLLEAVPLVGEAVLCYGKKYEPESQLCP